MYSILPQVTDFIEGMKTIRAFVEHEIPKIKGSRFIAAAWPLSIEESTRSKIEVTHNTQYDKIKQFVHLRSVEFPSAIHHCYSYRTRSGIERYSDDGEPSDTAGKPILNILQRQNLVDICIIVSRIFGGTKLGTGGLVRAYSLATTSVLEVAEIIDCIPMVNLLVISPLQHVHSVKRIAALFNATMTSTFDAKKATFHLQVPDNQVIEITMQLNSLSSGEIEIHKDT